MSARTAAAHESPCAVAAAVVPVPVIRPRSSIVTEHDSQPTELVTTSRNGSLVVRGLLVRDYPVFIRIGR